MLYTLRMGLITASFAFACPAWALAQLAAPVPKSAKPQSGSTPILSPETSDQQNRDALLELQRQRAGTTEWRSMLLQKESAVVNEQLKASIIAVQERDAQITDMHLSIESFPDILKMLQSSRVELLIDLAGLEARQQELLKQLDAQQQPNQQPLLAKELSIARELIKTSQEELDLLEVKFKAGQAIATEVLAAKKEFKLAELRLILAESKAVESSNVHSSELSKLILDRAEKSARLAVVEKLLKSTSDAKPLVTSLHDAQEQIKTLQSLSRRLSSDLLEARLEMEENQYLLEHSNQPPVDQK